MKISEHWPTHIGHVNFIQPALLSYIMTEYDLSSDQDDKNSNIFNTQSDVILNFKDVVIDHFSNYITNIYNCKPKNIRVNGWITGNRQGYSMIEHNHSGAAFSAVYYPLCESKNAGGDIHFTDPRTNANRGYPPEYRHIYNPVKIEPQTGDLLIFPSFLYHYVSAYHQNGRICIPIDFYIEKG